jgi:hypothetical protein
LKVLEYLYEYPIPLLSSPLKGEGYSDFPFFREDGQDECFVYMGRSDFFYIE